MPNTCSQAQASHHNLVMQELGRQMQAISEEASCSLWAWRLEDELPAALMQVSASGVAGQYRGVDISPVYADWLVSLAAELGHWVMPGPGLDYVPHSPRPECAAAGNPTAGGSSSDAEAGS